LSSSNRHWLTFHDFNVTGDVIEEEPPEEAINVQVEVVAVFGAILVAAAVILAVTLYVSKLRKRQSSTNSDVEMDTTDAGISKEFQISEGCEFDEYKPSVWRKTLRSVLLRLRGQEQHKDVYVIPSHLRQQLKQTYVY